MRLRALAISLLGIVLAGGSVFITHRLIQDTSKVPGEAEATTTSQIVVALGEIPFGSSIEPHMVDVMPWPAAAIPPGAFLSLAELLGEGNKEPRRARRAMVQGEPIVVSKVSNYGEKVTIADIIDPTKRAMAIRVDDVSGVGGFVTPGDRVDIVLTRKVDRDGVEATTFLQDIVVRATDQIADEDRDKPNVVRTVTVEVSPDQAQRLAVAQQAGHLSLTLRNLSSIDKIQPLRSLDLDELISKPVKKGSAPRPSVIMNRGGEREKVNVRGG